MDLPDAECAQLDDTCRQRGLSRAEALRQASRLWRDHPLDSLEMQQALRQEWREH
ncbi:MAG: CopG family transcriptional regulator [Prochlorococcaceae cyanobacterium]